MSLHNLKDYYYCSQLKPLVLWCDNGYEAKWKEMEIAIPSENQDPLGKRTAPLHYRNRSSGGYEDERLLHGPAAADEPGLGAETRSRRPLEQSGPYRTERVREKLKDFHRQKD
ncbi:Phosphoenolpyruvate transferase [Dissostichus eleginoides]|uniref:Phosphoenolpyruvate transferase n=1 Tax=Dissostichus eleginoides TaxID=100907 RepID=A0AAD9B342_DISEL|nr:Phosphoenolpyruvate transferase [Dissostichus eleginoides]